MRPAEDEGIQGRVAALPTSVPWGRERNLVIAFALALAATAACGFAFFALGWETRRAAYPGWATFAVIVAAAGLVVTALVPAGRGARGSALVVALNGWTAVVAYALAYLLTPESPWHLFRAAAAAVLGLLFLFTASAMRLHRVREVLPRAIATMAGVAGVLVTALELVGVMD